MLKRMQRRNRPNRIRRGTRSAKRWRPLLEQLEDRVVLSPTNVIINEVDSDTPGTDAAEFKASYLDNVPTYDWNDFWGPSNGQIMYR